MIPSIREIDAKYFEIRGELATMSINAGMIYRLMKEFIDLGGQIIFRKEINSDSLREFDRIYPIGYSGYGRCRAFYETYQQIFPEKLMLPHGMITGYEFLHNRYSAYLNIGRFNAKKIVYSKSSKKRAGDQFGHILELEESAYNDHALKIDFWKDIRYFEESKLSDEDVVKIIRDFEETTEKLNEKIDQIRSWYDKEYYRFDVPEKKAFITFNETVSPLMIRLMTQNLDRYDGYVIFVLDLE